MGERIMSYVERDITALSEKGVSIEYFTVIGGGAHLLYDTIKVSIGAFFGWPENVLEERVIHPNQVGIDPRYINCVGFMLLARDQISLAMGKDADTSFQIRTIIQDVDETAPERGKRKKGEAAAVAPEEVATGQ